VNFFLPTKYTNSAKFLELKQQQVCAFCGPFVSLRVFSGALSFLKYSCYPFNPWSILRGLLRGSEFLKTRIIPQRIKHWIEAEQCRSKRSGWTERPRISC